MASSLLSVARSALPGGSRRLGATSFPFCSAARTSSVSSLGHSFMRPKLTASPASHPLLARYYAAAAAPEKWDITKKRNIGISAHIDSGKTTLTERILFYTGRIRDIHEVRGKDAVGATMDSMELEKERGITIQSAATSCKWGETDINIIDTPGHVDFTIEVERALRVLDGAVLVICSVGGVQSQTFTVDRQMRRYNVPRCIFINKCDRTGADPQSVIDQAREKLNLNAAALQVPIGLETQHEGVVDLVTMKALYFEGKMGDEMVELDIPSSMVELCKQKRQEMIEHIASVDEEFGEKVLFEEIDPTEKMLKDAIRRTTIARTFVPVFMGSAFKNKGVQPLLDGVVDYLPNPTEVENKGLDVTNNEAEVLLNCNEDEPFAGLAFKLEEGRFGQLTYLRVYRGTLKRAEIVYNVRTEKKVKTPRLVKMHSNEMHDIDMVKAGDICAIFGLDCQSGDTFTSGEKLAMTSMHVPDPVISLSIVTKKKSQNVAFSKALQRFQKEDPTFRVALDEESSETIISGMGELHLDVYVERMKREYGVEVEVGKPKVAFRETVSAVGKVDYLHKKQSGGAGQYAKVVGYVEPIEGGDLTSTDFVNATVGGSIPPEYMSAVEKGYMEGLTKGPLTGNPISAVRFVVNDGNSHAVDSSEMAFKFAAMMAFKKGVEAASPQILEPIMKVTITAPMEFQGSVISGINRRRGMIQNSEAIAGHFVQVDTEVPLNNMFGYSTELRSATQGKGEYSMEYEKHSPVMKDEQEALIAAYKKTREN